MSAILDWSAGRFDERGVIHDLLPELSGRVAEEKGAIKIGSDWLLEDGTVMSASGRRQTNHFPGEHAYQVPFLPAIAAQRLAVAPA